MNNTVKVIRATHPSNVNTDHVSDEQSSTRRVAAYCRVSTDMDEQENSYEAQCSHYDRVIRETKGWRHAGIYADEGISGTQAWKRPRFLKMIEACENREIDLVITKSISRFSRNTVDCLEFVRKLKALGIAVIFEKEGINTLEQSGEIMLTILASLAQQESQSISENVKMGHRYNFQQGKGLLNTSRFLGYDRGDEPHTLKINPEQAVVVRRIYREFLEGFSPAMIARRLNDEGIPTASGSGKWYHTVISSILTNEKYCGELIMQKTYTPNFLTHRTRKNEGQLPRYYIRENHEPIIPREVFYQVQSEIHRRSLLKTKEKNQRKASGNSLLHKVFCGKCGHELRRFANKGDSNLSDWRCHQRVYFGEQNLSDNTSKCSLRSVKEHELMDAIVNTFNCLKRQYSKLVEMHATIRNGELKRIDSTLEKTKTADAEWDEKLALLAETESEAARIIHEQKEKLKNERNRLYAERAEFANKEVRIRMLLELVKLMLERRNNTAQILHDEHTESIQSDTPSCRNYEDFFRRTAFSPTDDLIDQTGKVLRYDSDMVQRYLESITVLDDGFEVAFKAGITVTV